MTPSLKTALKNAAALTATALVLAATPAMAELGDDVGSDSGSGNGNCGNCDGGGGSDNDDSDRTLTCRISPINNGQNGVLQLMRDGRVFMDNLMTVPVSPALGRRYDTYSGTNRVLQNIPKRQDAMASACYTLICEDGGDLYNNASLFNDNGYACVPTRVTPPVTVTPTPRSNPKPAPTPDPVIVTPAPAPTDDLSVIAGSECQSAVAEFIRTQAQSGTPYGYRVDRTLRSELDFTNYDTPSQVTDCKQFMIAVKIDQDRDVTDACPITYAYGWTEDHTSWAANGGACPTLLPQQPAQGPTQCPTVEATDTSGLEGRIAGLESIVKGLDDLKQTYCTTPIFRP